MYNFQLKGYIKIFFEQFKRKIHKIKITNDNKTSFKNALIFVNFCSSNYQHFRVISTFVYKNNGKMSEKRKKFNSYGTATGLLNFIDLLKLKKIILKKGDEKKVIKIKLLF